MPFFRKKKKNIIEQKESASQQSIYEPFPVTNTSYADLLRETANQALDSKIKEHEEYIDKLANEEIKRIQEYIDQDHLMALAKEGKTEFKWNLSSKYDRRTMQEINKAIVQKLKYYKGIRIVRDYKDIILIW